MEKPKKPQEPNIRDFSSELKGPPTAEETPFILAYRKYQKDLVQYEIDIERYEQLKLIRFVKNADEKLILRKYKIIKK